MKLPKAFLISIIVHALVFIPWLVWKKSLAPLAGGGGGTGNGGRVSVEIVSSTTQKNTLTPAQDSIPVIGEIPILKKEKTKSSPASTTGSSGPIGPGTGEGQGLGSGTGDGQDAVLATIRSKIERAKRYPELAKRASITGNSLVSFSINPGGQPENILLKKSSGSDLLDGEAKSTILRAAPLPAYPQPLEILIKFEIED